MKTADSIEQQPERKAARDNGDSLRENTQPVTQNASAATQAALLHGDGNRARARILAVGLSMI